MQAVVTGATGFTGQALCRRLVHEGWKVVAFVRSSSTAGLLQGLGVDCREVDITDRPQVLDAVEPVDALFNIAAAYRQEEADRSLFHKVNVAAVQNLVTAAARAGVKRFIHCSTVGVQGRIDDPPANEEYRALPGDHYQQSKWQGEQIARRAFEQGLPGVVVRPVGIYGPGDLRFLKLFKAVDRGVFVMIGNGSTLYHLTYIDDLIDGFLLAAVRNEALGEVFTFAGPRYTTIRELVDTVADALGKPRPRLRVPYRPVQWAAVACEALCRPLKITPPLYPRRVEFFASDRAFTSAKAAKLLGYSPRVDLADGVQRTVHWYREQGWLMPSARSRSAARSPEN